MTHPDRGVSSAVRDLAGDVYWAEASEAWELTDALRCALRPEYADASDAEMADALGNVLESMSPAEAFDFGSALSQITNSAKKLVADPTFGQIARTAIPAAAGLIGTVYGGPAGGALASQLGNLAVNALVPPPAPPPAARPPAAAAPPPVTPAPPITAPPPAVGAPAPGAAAPPLAPTSPVAGGSAAAAQGLVLTQQPDVLRALLATALGQHGRQQVSGIPVAQILSMLSQVYGRAAADADELMYLGQQPEATESVLDDPPGSSPRSLYTDLLGADNLELAEAAGWDGAAR
ncbi:MAG: hypothetical protein JWL68_711 [Actinomycetia bacterium]|nr:hypothetical protein [Actinomycetes bacterium]